MCANHSTTRAILLTGWDSNPRWNNFTRLTVWTVRPTTATRQYLPHFTGLTDRLPYGSGGFPLIRDSVVPVGIEPTTHRFSVCCSTNWATVPILTTTWLLSNFAGSYHSIIVVQGCRSSSLHLGFLSSRFRNLTTVASPCLWFPRESNSILKIFSLACRPLTQENQLKWWWDTRFVSLLTA